MLDGFVRRPLGKHHFAQGVEHFLVRAGRLRGRRQRGFGTRQVVLLEQRHADLDGGLVGVGVAGGDLLVGGDGLVVLLLHAVEAADLQLQCGEGRHLGNHALVDADGTGVVLGIDHGLGLVQFALEFLGVRTGQCTATSTTAAGGQGEVDRRQGRADGLDGHVAGLGREARSRGRDLPRARLEANHRVATAVVRGGRERRGRSRRILGDDGGALDGLAVGVLDGAADAAGLRRRGQDRHHQRHHHRAEESLEVTH